jgi:hypothetical protein
VRGYVELLILYFILISLESRSRALIRRIVNIDLDVLFQEFRDIHLSDGFRLPQER